MGRKAWVSHALVLVVFACGPVATQKESVLIPTPTPSPTTSMAASYPAFHAAEVGVAYTAVTPTASGGVQPYTWTVSAGALPPGLNLGSDGSVTGTATAAGTYGFTITAADSGDSTVPMTGQIAVTAAMTANLISTCLTQCNVELGCAEVCGQFGTLSGGVGPYSYRVASGVLPAGTSLNGLSLVGTFVGTSGYLKFTVQVTDALGYSTTVSPTFWIWDHISWSDKVTTCNGLQGAPDCGIAIPFTGGVPGGRPAATLVAVGAYCEPPQNCLPPPANAPANMTMVATSIGSSGGGSVTVTVPKDCAGPPIGCNHGYKGTIGLVLVDQALCGANVRCQSQIVIVEVFMIG